MSFFHFPLHSELSEAGNTPGISPTVLFLRVKSTVAIFQPYNASMLNDKTYIMPHPDDLAGDVMAS